MSSQLPTQRHRIPTDRTWSARPIGRRVPSLFALTAVLLATLITAPQASAALAGNVQLFYYPWYGSPKVLGSYRHWDQGNHTPPNDIGSNFYPVEGAYDSGDLNGTVDQHMKWIQETGAGTIIYSWWGQSSYEDSLAAGVLSVAAKYDIKVAWHIEPYTGRTAASVVSDIKYINSNYGSSPAFYRDSTHGNRPAFYIFESLKITDWSALDEVNGDNIVLTQTTDTSKTEHFGGMYTYDVLAAYNASGWAGVGAYCEENDLVWAPSVGPGYIDDRAVLNNTTPTLDRDNGDTYDKEWSNAITPRIGGSPDWVTVTSFNEWHEGTQIEPATVNPPEGFDYLTYDGAYGTSGSASQSAYLNRTKYWVEQFTNT